MGTMSLNELISKFESLRSLMKENNYSEEQTYFDVKIEMGLRGIGNEGLKNSRIDTMQSDIDKYVVFNKQFKAIFPD